LIFGGWKAWRRERVLKRAPLDPTMWQAVVARASYLHGMSDDELARLARWVALFIDAKEFSTTHNVELTEEMRLTVAAQACLLILNLDIDYYAGWREIIIYPEEFIARHEYVDEAGVVHANRHPMAGEAWPKGPIVLSWEDTKASFETDGVNVVIHEFAHKLDMLNGEANGYPPLHKEMLRREWVGAFSQAYDDFCRRVDSGEDTEIDAYASESPGEFFAVLSEVFFEVPDLLVEQYPRVHEQMKAFYKQDPLARLTASAIAI
jgi:MtfA peptidase